MLQLKIINNMNDKKDNEVLIGGKPSQGVGFGEFKINPLNSLQGKKIDKGIGEQISSAYSEIDRLEKENKQLSEKLVKLQKKYDDLSYKYDDLKWRMDGLEK